MRELYILTLILMWSLIHACASVGMRETTLISADPLAVKGSCTNKAGMASGVLAHDVRYELTADKLRIFSGKGLADFISFDLKHSFLSTRAATSRVKYEEAMLKMHENVTKVCHQQTIDHVTVQSSALVVTGTLAGAACHTGYTLKAMADSDQLVKLTITFDDSAFSRVTLRYSSSKDEGFFGFGEQYTYFNLKGRQVPIKVEEQGVGRGGSFTPKDLNLSPGTPFSTNAPMPVYITTKNRGLMLDTTAYSIFDLSSDNDVIVDAWQAPLTIGLWTAANPIELIELEAQKSGRFVPLAPWAHGSILGLQGGWAKAEDIIAHAQKAQNPVTGLWIQDWEGRRDTPFGSRLWWRWIADEKAYPEFKKFCAKLNAKGIKVLGYINPFLADVGPLYEKAKKEGYLVKNSQGKDYRLESVGTPMYLLDLTNPKAAKWIKSIIKTNMIDMGLSGWMADFGEYLPFDAKLYSGISAELYHNQYPVDWARINREAIREAGREGEIIFFMRAGYLGSARYTTLFWEGDQTVIWDEYDGLASAVTALLSSGVSGVALNHSDTGGYTTLKNAKRSRDLLYRWSEVSAFTPFFRTHEGNRPADNHQFYTDQASQIFFAGMGRLHYALCDYFDFLEKQAAAHGTPLVRALYLHYPNDVNTYSLRHQFLLGEDLLVLPVLHEGADKVSGYFPAGKWQNIWTKETFTGPLMREVDAPLGKPAAFVKMGGIWSERILNKIDKLPK